VFDRACRPAQVKRTDDQLMGMLSREVTRTGRSLSESYDEISLGLRMDEYGCNSVEYERDGSGKWLVVSRQGLGCVRMIGHALSHVTENAAWYEAALVRLSIDCRNVVSEETPCADGKTRVCERCEAWRVAVHSLESNFGISRRPARRRVQLPLADVCDSACAVNAPPLDVQRANEALRERKFLYIPDPEAHPLVFRTKTACRAYGKLHRFAADELEAWQAGNPRPPYLPPLRVDED
jgi:hypothetical protein